MKTLSDFKRRLTVGTKVRVTFYGDPLIVHGNTAQTIFPTPEPQDREVSRVQTNAVAFRKPDGRESWLFWPKAAFFRVENGAAVIVNDDGKMILKYEFL